VGNPGGQSGIKKGSTVEVSGINIYVVVRCIVTLVLIRYNLLPWKGR